MIDTETVKESVVSTARDVRGRAGDLAGQVREIASEPAPAKRGKGWLLLLLAAIGLGAIVYVVRLAGAEEPQPDVGPAPDAFGEAVLEEHAASRGGTRPVSTPGA